MVGLTVAAGPIATTMPAAAAPGDAEPDFDNDGVGDYAVGAAGEARGGGGVYAFYGTAASTGGRRQVWSQNTEGVGGSTAADDAFGAAVAAGDFDGDGYDDLAVGVPGDDVGGRSDAGSVNVLYGSASGLTAAGSEWWYLGRTGVAGTPGTSDLFGTALVAGDFDGDGRDELAIGIPGKNTGGRVGAGTVTVLRGCACGLTGSGSRWFSQNSNGVGGTSGIDDNFGFALAVGRFGGDAIDDLVIGAPGESIGGVQSAGAVHVLPGTLGSGLTGVGSQMWSEAGLDVSDANGAEPFDFFGWSVATGDLNRDGTDDLAAGAPGEYSGSTAFAGAAFVAYGDAGLLGKAGAQMINQETNGVSGASSANQEFGHSVMVVAAHNDDGGAPDDSLVVGVPYRSVSSRREAGMVFVFRSSPTGVVTAANSYFTLAGTDLPGSPTAFGWFGITLGAADADGDGVVELLFGSPGEDAGVPAKVAAGAFTRLAEDDTAPVTAGAVHWTQDSAGVAGSPGTTDFFASSITQ